MPCANTCSLAPSELPYERVGIETIAHLQENGRVTVMFTAFQGPPRICRLFGRGEVFFYYSNTSTPSLSSMSLSGTVFEFDTPEYNALISADKRQPGSRAVIMVDVYKVSTVRYL